MANGMDNPPNLGSGRLPRKCFHCGQPGHKFSECTRKAEERHQAGKDAFRTYLSHREQLRLLGGAAMKKRSRNSMRHCKKLIAWMQEERDVCDPVSAVRQRRDGTEEGLKETARDLHRSYREYFGDVMTKVESSFRDRLLATATETSSGEDLPCGSYAGDDGWKFSWHDELTRAVREGVPADFTNEKAIRIYALDKLASRTRQLVYLMMDDNPLSTKIRALFLPVRRSMSDASSIVEGRTVGDRPVVVGSLGGGPGFDHVALCIVSAFLYHVQSNLVKDKSDALPLQAKRVETRVCDLYDTCWSPTMRALVECSQVLDVGADWGEGVSMNHSDLRSGLGVPANRDFRNTIAEADLIVFQFVLHENASFLLKDDGLVGGAVGDLLRRAVVGTFIVCTDSGNFLWPALKKTAAIYGWTFLGDVENDHNIILGPKSFVILERLEMSNDGVVSH